LSIDFLNLVDISGLRVRLFLEIKGGLNMKISIDDLIKKKACVDQVVRYKNLGLAEIDWDKITKVTTDSSIIVDGIKWLIGNDFKIFPIIIELKESDSGNDGELKKMQSNRPEIGLERVVHRSNQIWVYNKKGLLVELININGYKEEWEYDPEINYKIAYKNSNGRWKRWEYNEKKQLVRCESSDSQWDRWVYNEVDLLVLRENSTGFMETWMYDENDLQVHYDNSEGISREWKYDKNGKQVEIKEWEISESLYHTRPTRVLKYHKKWKYDRKGRLIKYIYKKSDLKKFWEKYKYNKNGHIILRKDSEGRYFTWEYDENNKVIRYDAYDITLRRNENSKKFQPGKSQPGQKTFRVQFTELWEEYMHNKQGKMTLRRFASGYKERWKYNEKGQVIRHENSEGNWEIYKYDENGKCIDVDCALNHPVPLGGKIEFDMQKTEVN